MTSGYVLYNPLAGSGNSAEELKRLEEMLDAKLTFQDVTKIEDYQVFINAMEENSFLVIAGGDGTMNRFINATENIQLPKEVLYYPCGSGNDFAREVAKDNNGKPISIVQYIQGLPKVEVNGKSFRFINGIGFGIDGYCCMVGDEQRAASNKKVDYTGIAIKGLLFHYKPSSAKVTVDGKTEYYKDVWLAPTMHGRYYGGGMIPAPEQDRTAQDRTLSVMVFRGRSKLKSLIIFPSLFKGEHIKHKKNIFVLSGKQITVEFDSPRPLQIDGETIPNVISYTATACPVNAEVNCG